MRLVLLLLVVLSSYFSYSQIDRKEIFSAISGTNTTKIEAEIDKLNKLSKSDEVDAFKGALLMKWSSFQKTPKDKLAKFNEGKKLLESAIQKHSANTEYRFLRLLIQENAPKQLKYNSDIQEDAAKILSSYSELKQVTKDAVLSYAKKSAYLIGL